MYNLYCIKQATISCSAVQKLTVDSLPLSVLFLGHYPEVFESLLTTALIASWLEKYLLHKRSSRS